jgi:aspartate racemase
VQLEVGMITIGLLGGMSAESTAQYYRLLNEDVRQRLGGLHSADCLLYSVDFAPIAGLQAEGRWNDAAELPAAGARRLQAGGADFFLLCTNTMHKVADAVQAAVSIPLLHIADATAEAVTSADVRRVGLLGTSFTMEQPFLRDRLAGRGLEVITPTAADRAEVHRAIYEELCGGVIREESGPATARSSITLSKTAPRASSWPAPRSNCLSGKPTARCRCSRQPACTPKARSTHALAGSPQIVG